MQCWPWVRVGAPLQLSDPNAQTEARDLGTLKRVEFVLDYRDEMTVS